MIGPNHEYKSKKKLTRDEWITAKLLSTAIVAVDAYYCQRHEEDTEGDPDTLKNITDEVLKNASIKQIENMHHILTFINMSEEKMRKDSNT